MTEQRKIYRVFQLIARLRGPFGCMKETVADDFGVSVRTIERYFELLTDLGFEIARQEKCFRIMPGSKGLINPEEFIVFSIEEAFLIREAIVNCANSGPLQKTLLDKLYALTDLDELAATLYHRSVSSNISRIRQSIREKCQVILKSYHSINQQKPSDRLVEPIQFYYYFRYLLAYEPSSRQVKQFKTERIGDVVLTNQPFLFEKRHDLQRIDVFGLSGNTPVKVRLRLSRRAALLLREEFQDASLFIFKRGRHTYFEGPVYKFEGVGRFVLGLLGEVKVEEPEALIRYVNDRVNGYLTGDG